MKLSLFFFDEERTFSIFEEFPEIEITNNKSSLLASALNGRKNISSNL